MFKLNVDYDKVGLRHYRLIRTVYCETGIIPPEGKPIKTKFGFLGSDGVLILFKGFCWDGATGAVDTPAVMFPSLIHDWGCEAVNNKQLPIAYRAKFDDLFEVHLKAHGLDGNVFKEVRKAYMSWAVHKWGEIKHGY